MKRSAVMSVAMLLSVMPAVATAQGVFGIKGGGSWGNVSNSGVLPGDLEGRTGFAVGLWLGTPMTAGISVGLEGLYAQRGVQSAVGLDSRELDYIDVPLYLRVGLPTEGVTPFLYGGPQFSWEVRCVAGAADCPDTERPRTSYAAVVGAGVRFGGTAGVTIEGRYMYGLTDLELGTITDDESYQTRSFLLLAGIGF
jgi:hypothetical protein